jgi:hypothetical protein
VRAILALVTTAVVVAATAGFTSAHVESAACVATTVRYQPAKHPTLGDLPWVLAKPQTKAVIGFLVSYPRTLRDERVNGSDGLVLWRTGEKIVWTVPSGRLTLVARRLDGPGSFRVALSKTSAGFVSRPRFPTVGCWRLSLGGATVVARVVETPAHLGCGATRASTQELAAVRPRSAGIAGAFSWRTDDGRLLLYTHGIGPGDLYAKVLWWSKRGHGALGLTGIRLDGRGGFSELLNEAGANPAPPYYAAFPSEVDVPAPGCWLLRLRVQRDAGVLVVQARDR